MMRHCLFTLLVIFFNVTGIHTIFPFPSPGLSVAAAQEPAPKASAPGTADAERIRKIESTIRSDQQKLIKLQNDLKDRQSFYQELSGGLKKLKGQLDEKKKQLDELTEKKETSKAEVMKKEVEDMQQKYDLLKKQTDLVYQAEKTIGEQIKALEDKIEQGQKRIEDLRSAKKPEVPAPSAVVTPPPGKPEPVKPSAPSPTVPMLPTVPVPAAQEGTEAETKAEPETPEQIEARKEAEKKKEEAREAEEKVVRFVERKNVLDDEISREKKLLETAEERRDNLYQMLEKQENDLEKKAAAGAGSAQLRKTQRSISRIHKEIGKIIKVIRLRTARIDELNEQLEALQEEQQRVLQAAEEKREEAEAARKRSVWLQSPFHPRNVFRWVVNRGPGMLMVIAAVVVLLYLSKIFVKRLAHVAVRNYRGVKTARENREKTLAISFQSAVRGVIILVGTLLILEEAGVDIKTVLGGAAIIGLALAFGAQNLMRDYFNGIMILLEDQYELNDIVTIGDVTGAVEKVSMRITVLRDLEGKTHFIPNGQITRTSNWTYEWMQAVFDIRITYKENVDRVMDVLMELAKEMRTDPALGSFITEDPVMLGVEAFGDTGPTIKFIMKTAPGKMWSVKREMLRRIKNKFDELGIEIPVPQRVIMQRREKAEGED